MPIFRHVAITAVNNGLADFKGNVLFSSFDHQFIQTVANRIIEIVPATDTAPAAFYDKTMDFEDYLKQKYAEA